MKKDGKGRRAKLSGLGGVSCLALMKSCRSMKKKAAELDRGYASDLIAVGTTKGSFALLDIGTGHWTFRQSEAHASRINCIEVLNGKEVFTASNDRLVRLWDIRQRYY